MRQNPPEEQKLRQTPPEAQKLGQTPPKAQNRREIPLSAAPLPAICRCLPEIPPLTGTVRLPLPPVFPDGSG